jgi:hypothetical protein
MTESKSPARKSGVTKGKMQKRVSVTLLTVRERGATGEAAVAIQRKRRLERRAASGFQAEATGTARFRSGDDRFQNSAAYTPPEGVGIGLHRAHFAATIRQYLQGTQAGNPIALPCGPDGRLGNSQTRTTRSKMRIPELPLCWKGQRRALGY